MIPAFLSRPLPVFSLGALLGSCGVWLAPIPAPSHDHAAPASTVPSPVGLSSWAWRDSLTPPSLDTATADAAVSTWLATRDSSGKPPALRDRVEALRAILVRLPIESFPRLLSGLAPRSTADERILCRIAFGSWLERDPASAARWASAYGKGALDLGRQAMRAWAELDPAAASSWAFSLSDPHVAEEFARVALPLLAANNPVLAHELLSSRDPATRDRLVGAVFNALAKSDPASALRAYGPSVWKNGANFWNLRAHVAAWANADPAAAVAWVLAQPRAKTGDVDDWLASLLHESPNRTAIATAIVNTPGLPSPAEAVSAIMFQWCREEPEKALAWLNGIGDPKLRLRILSECSSTYGGDHPQHALPFAFALPEGATRARRLRTLLESWARIDPSATLAWIRAHGDPDVAAVSVTVQTALLAGIAGQEPATAIAEWAALSDPALKRGAINSIAGAWGRTDPEAALKWSTSEETRRAVENYSGFRPDLLHAWARKDPEAALRWAEEQIKAGQGAGKTTPDDYLSALAGTGSQQADPTATAALYAKIEDPALRTQTLTGHVREWLAKDPAAARAWLESTSALTPEQAAALLSPAR